jgi:hypothetical protein
VDAADLAHEAFLRLLNRCTRWSESLRHAFHELPDPDWIRRS